jgi:hypothetical protein
MINSIQNKFLIRIMRKIMMISMKMMMKKEEAKTKTQINQKSRSKVNQNILMTNN